jgi:hypothetical protein
MREEHSEGPHVRLERVVGFSVDDFGRFVLKRSRVLICQFTRVRSPHGNAKICQFRAAVFVEQNVAHFDVVMGNAPRMAERERAQNLSPEAAEAIKREALGETDFALEIAAAA